MKTPTPNSIRSFCLLCFAVWLMGPQAVAQTPPALSIQLYAGLTITGAVGNVYSVECITDLAQTNNARAWHSLEFLQLLANPYLWADKSAPATGTRFYRAVEFTVPTNMVFIPPGTFRMGSPTNEVGRYDNEGPQTAVTISRGFCMAKHEVTQEEYLALMGNNPSFYNGFRTNLPAPPEGTNYGIDLSRPVETVRWSNAVAYCEALTQRERVAGRIPTNVIYRLPTEAEWEYACRAWTSTRFSYGDDLGYTNLTDYAWYSDNSSGVTHSVGQKLPNPWDLYNMHGNVWEWTQDGYSYYLPGGIALDPQTPTGGLAHEIRGGAFDLFGDGKECRSARRDTLVLPQFSGPDVGFRVVLAPGQP